MLQFRILVKYSLYVADDVCKQIVKKLLKPAKMVFSDEDKVLIKNLYLLKNYGPAKLMSEFPEKNWKRRGLENFLESYGKQGRLIGRRGVTGQDLPALKTTYRPSKSWF